MIKRGHHDNPLSADFLYPHDNLSLIAASSIFFLFALSPTPPLPTLLLPPTITRFYLYIYLLLPTRASFYSKIIIRI